jgi:hypothetical protein
MYSKYSVPFCFAEQTCKHVSWICSSTSTFNSLAFNSVKRFEMSNLESSCTQHINLNGIEIRRSSKEHLNIQTVPQRRQNIAWLILLKEIIPIYYEKRKR